MINVNNTRSIIFQRPAALRYHSYILSTQSCIVAQLTVYLIYKNEHSFVFILIL
jgi:hypothetical protein